MSFGSGARVSSPGAQRCQANPVTVFKSVRLLAVWEQPKWELWVWGSGC